MHIEDVKYNLIMQGISEEEIKSKYLSKNEDVQLSCTVVKINKFGISQSRYLLITNNYIFNLSKSGKILISNIDL